MKIFSAKYKEMQGTARQGEYHTGHHFSTPHCILSRVLYADFCIKPDAIWLCHQLVLSTAFHASSTPLPEFVTTFR